MVTNALPTGFVVPVRHAPFGKKSSYLVAPQSVHHRPPEASLSGAATIKIRQVETGPGSRTMRTMDINYAGRTVRLANLPEYEKFYRKLSSGRWEASTFRTLARNLDRDTVCVDIGAWIGVTPMWSAQIAKSVIAVEPDPKCVGILREIAAGAPNVTVLEGALAADRSVAINAVEGFGSSETSVLDIGDGECATVRGISMDEIMRHADGEEVFVKIDIEGYEFAIRDEIAKLRNYRVRGLQVAVHPQLYEKTLKGNPLSRRLRAAWATWQFGQLFNGFLPAPRFAKFGSLAGYVIKGVLFRRVPKGADLVFERHPVRSEPETP
jgi:FkbM family methyltransferase